MKRLFVLISFILLSGCSAGLSSHSSCQIRGEGLCASMESIERWADLGVLSPHSDDVSQGGETSHE